MSKVTVELGWEVVDDIVIQQMRETREGLERDLEKVKSTGKGFVFDLDMTLDIPLIEKHIEACNLICKFYGGK